MEPAFTEEIDGLARRWIDLTSRISDLSAGKARVEAELEARKRSLRRQMSDCQAAGHDPNDLKESIAKQLEVLRVKMSGLEAEVSASEKLLRPMLDELQAGR